MESISINYTNLFNYPYNQDGERLCLLCAKISDKKIYCESCFGKYNLKCHTCDELIIKKSLADQTTFRFKLNKNPSKNNYCSKECYRKPKLLICKHPDCEKIINIDSGYYSKSSYCSHICKTTNYTMKRRTYELQDLNYCEHCKKPFHTRATKETAECPRCLEETRLNLTKKDI